MVKTEKEAGNAEALCDHNFYKSQTYNKKNNLTTIICAPCIIFIARKTSSYPVQALPCVRADEVKAVRYRFL